MRRFLAIVLLALLPLQFSWAAVAPYCGHETQAGAEHLGHHDHQHHADAGDDAGLVASSNQTSDVDADAGDGKVPGALDLDCGHCHGHCGVMPSLTPDLLAAPPAGRHAAALDEASGAQAPTRPERPQWAPLA